MSGGWKKDWRPLAKTEPQRCDSGVAIDAGLRNKYQVVWGEMGKGIQGDDRSLLCFLETRVSKRRRLVERSSDGGSTDSNVE